MSAATLIAEGRYSPCGVGFSKQFVFYAGGGPALYVRGAVIALWLGVVVVAPMADNVLEQIAPGIYCDTADQLAGCRQ
jgi:hypothetical protein